MTAHARARPFAVVGAWILAGLALASDATADMTKDQCIDADTQAQMLRRDGKLAASLAQLQRCGSPSCPEMIREDCTRRIDEVQRAQPTIIFSAKDGAGHDLVDVKVTVDGQPLTNRLEGKAFTVDPGARSFTFTVADQAPVTQSLVITEGEKDRHERIIIGVALPAPAPAPTPTAAPETTGTALPSAPPPDQTSGGGMGTRKIVGLVLAGTGVAGVAVGSVFGLLTISAVNQQNTDCASMTSCSSPKSALSDHSSAQTDGTVSDVAFIAGGALLAVGAVLFFLPTGASDSTPATGLLVAPSVGPGGGGLLLRGGF
jgi:hypothetical protein